MLIINKSQITTFAENEYLSFLDKMAESIAENFGIENNENLKKEVVIYVVESQKFDFEYEETIEQYLYIKWKYDSFKKTPFNKNILDILTFPDRDEETKIDELFFYFENLL